MLIFRIRVILQQEIRLVQNYTFQVLEVASLVEVEPADHIVKAEVQVLLPGLLIQTQVQVILIQVAAVLIVHHLHLTNHDH